MPEQKSANLKTPIYENESVQEVNEVLETETKEELDAVAYFHGTGFYANEQDPLKNPKPSIFDTRQSFLFKMHNSKVRTNFLNS